MIRIKNINGIEQKNCGCESLLKHWEKYSGQKVVYCQAVSCTNTNLAGALVQKVGDETEDWYVYPLCKAHHKTRGELSVYDQYKFVLAFAPEICNKD